MYLYHWDQLIINGNLAYIYIIASEKSVDSAPWALVTVDLEATYKYICMLLSVHSLS